MRTEIPQGLRVTYLINFVFALIFGLAGTFAAKLVGDIAGHPVHDPDVNGLLGVAALTFALGSWYAYRAESWEPIKLVTAMVTFFNLFGGVLGVVAYFFPSLLNTSSLPPVQLLVSVVLSLLGISFAYFYMNMQARRVPVAASGTRS